jgi:hypothetical protein
VALAEAITRTFSTALTSGNVRIGLEEAGSNSNDMRAVLQSTSALECLIGFATLEQVI